MSDAFAWLAFFGAFLGTLVLMAERGYRDGMRLAWFLATLAVPGWFFVSFRSVTVDAMTGVALATLLAMCFRPFSGTRTTWVVSDLLLIAVILAGVISDAVNRTLIRGRSLVPVTFFRIRQRRNCSCFSLVFAMFFKATDFAVAKIIIERSCLPCDGSPRLRNGYPCPCTPPACAACGCSQPPRRPAACRSPAPRTGWGPRPRS